MSVVANAQTVLTLEECKLLAAENNADIKVAKGNVTASQHQEKEAFTNYFPQVSATGFLFKSSDDMVKYDVKTSDVISPEAAAALPSMLPAEMAPMLTPLMQMVPENISGGMLDGGAVAAIAAVQPVFAGGQIVNGNKLAKIGTEVSELQLQLSENKSELTTEQYYWQIVSLKEKLNTLATVSELLSRLESDVNAAQKAGVAIKNDLLQVQIKINEVNKNRVKVENGLTLTRRLLAQHIGRTGEEIDVVMPDDLSEEIPDSLYRNHSESVENTAEYRLLQANVRANELQKKMSTGKNLPTVAVGAAYTVDRVMETNNNFGMIFATASVPISGWWGGSHATKRQAIALDNARTQLDNSREMLIINMENCWNTLTDARTQLDIARQTLEQSSENLRLNQDYYRVGTSTMSDLLTAQQQHQQALDAYTDARIEYQMAVARYRQAVGE